MAQWKETLEPYIKVNERIRTTTIVPTAGEDLIIGATVISDSGPSYPVLITSQREFLNVFASQEITKGYIESLDNFYDDGTGTKSDVASTMWLNAYRLAGSTNMLIVRATKGADMNYVVSLDDGDNSKYIVRDGQLLKQINPGTGFSLTIDRLGGDASNRVETGWAISINEIGIIGNLVGDDGPVYEYFASDLRELVEYLNGTSKFFCPNPKYYKMGKNNNWIEAGDDEKPQSVYFKEVYLAHHFIDETGFNRFYSEPREITTQNPGSATDTYGTKGDGLAYLLATATETPTVASNLVTSTIINLNDNSNYSGVDYPDEGYLINTFNSNSEIKIRFRRFNHDAVILREDIKPTVVADGESPYEVITDVVDHYINLINNSEDPDKDSAIQRIIERDFYEVAVLDPSLDKDPLSFCVGNYPGRGDITLDELNETLKMVNVHIPSMGDLGLTYYGATVEQGQGGNAPEIPSGLPAAPRGYQWVPVTDSSEIDDQRSVGNIFVISENLGEWGWTSQNVSGYYTLGGSNKQVKIPVSTNIGSNAEEVEEGGFVSINNVVYQVELEDGNASLVPYSAGDLPINVTPIADGDILKIAGSYYEFSADNIGSNPLIKKTNIQLYFEDALGDLIPAKGTEEIGYDMVNDLNSALDVTERGTMTVGDERSPYLTPGVGNMVRDEMSPSDVLDSEGDSPAYYAKGTELGEGDTIYRLAAIGKSEIFKDLSINTEETDILTVTPNDLMRSISAITEDEVYTTEGLTDLGNTDLIFQTYLCNMAKNENYFYPISTLYSTNYLAIANYRSRLAQDSYKLYTSAPWDVDSGTVGFKFHACPSVIYWEAVSRNRSMNREFASVFGFSSNGQVLYTNPVTEFTKKQRQLLLSRQVNTVMWNTQNQTWNMNDCYTMTSENHILNEDGNSRLFIRINKAIPTLLRPLIGRKLNNATYSDAETILKYWFERTILTMQYSVSDYKVTIANLEANDDQARRQNKMYVLVECLFARSLKYVIVYSDALDMGMEFVGEIV